MFLVYVMNKVNVRKIARTNLTAMMLKKMCFGMEKNEWNAIEFIEIKVGRGIDRVFLLTKILIVLIP